MNGKCYDVGQEPDSYSKDSVTNDDNDISMIYASVAIQEKKETDIEN